MRLILTALVLVVLLAAHRWLVAATKQAAVEAYVREVLRHIGVGEHTPPA